MMPQGHEPNREHWDRVEEVFAEALAAEDSARTAILDARCQGAGDLRRDVEALLAAHVRAGEFISPPTTDVERTSLGDHGHLGAGARIAAFQLRERIARGGMGEVYRAERVDGEFTQQVAVKVIAARLHGAETLRRFRAERQILASLQHPNIVTLVDGGVTADGQPFIVMEFIDGQPLTEYCRRQASPVDARLRLFQQLCSAVAFAHRHLVVHRDLKPSNVLVTSEGVVKVLDFGVAKLLEPSGESAGAGATQSLLAPMTPNYASPEQLRGQPITTACDVYALGVMLYELVSGKRPYETSGKTLDEIVAMAIQREPTRPSAAAAAAELPYERERLRGDLDAIVSKAMAKDPERRYASAKAIADDLGRALTGLPVVAREPSLRYLARKTIGRHRAAFGVAAVALVLLVVALVGALWQARVAARERERAEQGLADVRALANSLVFEVHDAIQNLPGATAARQLIVKRALVYVDRLAADQPRDVILRRELADAYYRLAEVQGNPVRANLGDIDGALTSYRKALALREQLASAGGGDPADIQRLAATEFGIGTVLRARGDMTGARSAYTRAVTIMEPLLERSGIEPDPRHTIVAGYQRLAELANAAGAADEAGRIVTRAVVHAQAVLARSPADTTARLNLALIYREDATSLTTRGKLLEALGRIRESRVMLEQLVTEHPLDTRYNTGLLFVLYSEGDLLERLEDHAAALAVYGRQLDVATRHAERDRQNSTAQISVAVALRQVARVMMRTNRSREAVSPAQQGREIMAAVVARDPTSSWAVDDFATLALLHGQALWASDARANRASACGAFKQAREQWDSLKQRKVFPDTSAEDYAITIARLKDC
jgi:non-specific serine/threonine protein kinase/serine/threonine-protein kinase